VLLCIGALALGASGLRGIDLGVSLVPTLPAGDPVRVPGEDAARGFAPGIAAPVELLVEQPGVAARRAALARRAGIGDAEANRAAQATLATLSERLSRSEARTLGAQLPSAFRTALVGASRWAERFALDELVTRVASRSDTDPATALEHERAVGAALDGVQPRYS
jgi:uncharacterized membrane protein YdfJ with MMPL/SSD domain